MKKYIILLLVLVLIGSLGFKGYKAFFQKPKPIIEDHHYLVNQDKDMEGKEDKVKEEVKEVIKEKTLEEKERQIEADKPKNKIKVDLLKDTTNATEDDTLATLPDAPLHYKIDGVESFKLELGNIEVIERGTSKKNSTFTDEVIKRLQAYGYNWYTGYEREVPPRVKLGEYYEKYPEWAEIVAKEYIPRKVDIFKNAIIGWGTDPNLVYKTPRGNYGVRGILQISYLREDNMFDLKPYVLYERDTEFRYANTTDGLFLRQIIYLSDWREVKSWENPYE